MVFMFKRTDLFPWVGACNPAGYDNDHYMAYCHSTRYGDYEHFALYNSLEPRAVDSMKQASVFFLGNSNTQYAFSTDAVTDYFNNAGVLHYVMGFGQGAKSPVAEAVIRKHNVLPRLIVANVDPFFSPETNGTFQRVLDGGNPLDKEFNRKQWLQRWHARTCSDESNNFYNLACKGTAETLYRNRTNGHWVTDYYRDNGQHPVTETDDLLDQFDSAVEIANAFIKSVNVPRECVVLTVSPKTGTPTAFADALASRLDTTIITPKLEGLVTIDHSHLDDRSAERWSAAFLKEFDEVFTRCAAGVSHASKGDE